MSAKQLFLINILHQTATVTQSAVFSPMLFLINILHQTATYNVSIVDYIELFLINILHQTATMSGGQSKILSCSLSIFYIKPQLYIWGDL